MKKIISVKVKTRSIPTIEPKIFLVTIFVLNAFELKEKYYKRYSVMLPTY